MSDQLTKTLERIGEEVETFKEKQSGRIDALVNDISDLQDEMEGQKAIGVTGGGRSHTAAKAQFDDHVRTGEPMLAGKSMSGAVAADGGHAVPTEISNIVRDQLLDLSPMRRVARVEQATSPDYRINVGVRGTASGWVSELAARPVTASPQLAQVTVPMGELYSNVKVSQHLIDDANFAVGEYVLSHVADEFALQEGGAFIAGDGSDKPEGFLNRSQSTLGDTSRTFGELQYTPTGVSGGFAASDPQDVLVETVYSLRPSYRQGDGVAWLMNSSSASVIRKFKDNEGRFIWQDSLRAGEPSRLLGYPVEIFEDMPVIGADSVSVAFGNWRRGYSIVDRIGMRVLRDPFTDKGNVLFYVTKRVGGSVTDSDAIKLLKFGVS